MDTAMFCGIFGCILGTLSCVLTMGLYIVNERNKTRQEKLRFIDNVYAFFSFALNLQGEDGPLREKRSYENYIMYFKKCGATANNTQIPFCKCVYENIILEAYKAIRKNDWHTLDKLLDEFVDLVER